MCSWILCGFYPLIKITFLRINSLVIFLLIQYKEDIVRTLASICVIDFDVSVCMVGVPESGLDFASMVRKEIPCRA